DEAGDHEPDDQAAAPEMLSELIDVVGEVRPVELVVVLAEAQAAERRPRGEAVTREAAGALREHREMPEAPLLPDRERDDRGREAGEHRAGELEAAAVCKREHRTGQEQRGGRLD